MLKIGNYMVTMTKEELVSMAPANAKPTTIEAILNDNNVFLSTNMSGKMEGVHAISTSNLINPYCILRKNNSELICSKCFADTQQERYYYSFLHSYRNTELLTGSILDNSQLPFASTELLRLESFGDLINHIQLINYLNIAAKNSHCKVALWTKNIWILRKVFLELGYKKPDNLHIVYSSPFINKVANIPDELRPYINHVFTVFNDENKASINCGARDCKKCKRCYISDEFYINELLK